MRMVIYGPEELAGRSRNFYSDARKTGEVAVAHEILDPKVIDDPEQIKDFRKSPHIHWEVENILKNKFKLKRD